MDISTYRFTFCPTVPMHEVEATLRLALLALQGLLGENILDQLKIEMDQQGRVCTFEAPPEAGEALALIFGVYVRCEFGHEAVNPVHSQSASVAATTGARR